MDIPSVIKHHGTFTIYRWFAQLQTSILFEYLQISFIWWHRRGEIPRNPGGAENLLGCLQKIHGVSDPCETPETADDEQSCPGQKWNMLPRYPNLTTYIQVIYIILAYHIMHAYVYIYIYTYILEYRLCVYTIYTYYNLIQYHNIQSLSLLDINSLSCFSGKMQVLLQNKMSSAKLLRSTVEKSIKE